MLWPLSRLTLALAVLVFGISVSEARTDGGVCDAPKPVCAARGAVFQISAFDPFGSAVRIGPGLLVTNRHVIADETEAKIHLKTGATVKGEVVPTTFGGDLVLIRAKLPDGPQLVPAENTPDQLYSIGLDIGARAISVFGKGVLLLKPAAGKTLARLYHTAHSQPGTSGGALVSASGELVGIVTSGGEGRNEALPAKQIKALRAASGPKHSERSLAIGAAYRECTIIVSRAMRSRDKVPPDVANEIESVCRASGNRQLTDLAGQVLGRSRMFERSVKLFRRGLDEDPNAINTRLSLVVILVYAQRYAEAAEPVKWLLNVIPKEREAQLYAVRIGKSTKDMALVERALALIKQYNPANLEAAQRFLNAPARAR